MTLYLTLFVTSCTFIALRACWAAGSACGFIGGCAVWPFKKRKPKPKLTYEWVSPSFNVWLYIRSDDVVLAEISKITSYFVKYGPDMRGCTAFASLKASQNFVEVTYGK